MMSNQPGIQVEATVYFSTNLKTLAKRYRNIRKDVQPLLDQLAAGQVLGEQVPNVGYPVYKVRVPNRDSQRGKRGGYRLLYYLCTETSILLITIYSKSDQGDIAATTIREIITEYQADS
jgi:mRNA-degrading endonuclease RelE of RelBE toxin-antitoxin system